MRYRLYGLTIETPWRLPCPSGHGPADVRFTRSRRRPSPVRQDWFWREVSPDGSEHLVWTDHAEFHMSADARTISYLPLNRATEATLETFMLGQVLSFALLRRGREPFHATVLERDDRAVALMGPSGRGKSTLAASMLTHGWRLLTDDLMVLDGLDALPGLSRIKLFPRSAKVLGLRGPAIAKGSSKEVIQLPPSMFCDEQTRVERIYELRATQAARCTIRRMSARSALMSLTANTFNRQITETGRLRQQFTEAARITASVPVSSISYRKTMNMIPIACDAIERHQGHALESRR
jgi:hypothetical protein